LFRRDLSPEGTGRESDGRQSRNRTDLLASGAKIQHPAGGSRIPAGSRLRRRHNGESALHWRRQRDLSDRANLLFDWASTGRLREATLPGRPDSIRDPIGTANASAAERRCPQMNTGTELWLFAVSLGASVMSLKNVTIAYFLLCSGDG